MHAPPWKATWVCALIACGTPSTHTSNDASDIDASGTRVGDVTVPMVPCQVSGDGRTTVTFINHCARAVGFAGSNITGGSLAVGAYACRDVGSATDSLPALRYWGFYDGEDPGNGRYTLAEFTFNTNFHHFDWYDISHVDADNLPMQIIPVAMPHCPVPTCTNDLVPGCPSVGQYRDTLGDLISCVSPERNNGSSPVAVYFHAGCADGYAWSGDNSATKACAGEDYDVVFCP